MKKFTLFLSGALVATPFVASAQADPTYLSDLLTAIGDLINLAVPIVIGLAVLLFLWGLARYILNQDDAEARAGARSIMIWGVVIIFVMIALWGLVAILAGLFGVDSAAAPTDAINDLSPIQ